MNEGTGIKLQGLRAMQNPGYTMYSMVMNSWEKENDPKFESFCKDNDDKRRSRYYFSKIRCADRQRDSLYSFSTGFDLCQCDSFCELFHDCCDDYVGNHDLTTDCCDDHDGKDDLTTDCCDDYDDNHALTTDCCDNYDGKEDVTTDCCDDHDLTIDCCDEDDSDNDVTATLHPNHFAKTTPPLSKQDVSAHLQCVSTHASTQIHQGFGFYVITSCLEDYNDTAVAAKCQASAISSISDILINYPVEVDDKVYKSVYCALCNGHEVNHTHFWRYIKSSYYNAEDKCEKLMTRLQNNITDVSWYDNMLCRGTGTFYPWAPSNPHEGGSRMGKLCVQRPDIDNQRAWEKRNPVSLLMKFGTIEPVDTHCICQHCRETIFPFLSLNMEKISQLQTRPHDFKFFETFQYTSHSGALSELFRARPPGSNGFHNILVPDKNPNLNFSMISESSAKNRVSVMVSLSGSGSSIFLLLFVVGHIIRGEGLKSSKARRCQLGIIFAKLFFFLSLCGGMAMRHLYVACQIFSVAVHYTMFASFGHSFWFGWKVARMLWDLNHNMAGVSPENNNNNQRFGFLELVVLLVIWLGSLILVMSLWIYDYVADDSLINYGRNETCYLSGEKGMLYFVVIPASAFVLANILTLLFSIYQFVKIFNNNEVSRDMPSKFALFLGKLIVFQSTQWIFGIVFYLTENEVFALVFEFLVAFEGLFLFISFFSANIGRVFCFVRRYGLIILMDKLPCSRFIRRNEED